jgi:beta-galactosidase
MNKKYFFIILFIIGLKSVSGETGQLFVPPPNGRIKTNIDLDWRFINRDFPAEEETHQVNDLIWENIDLPHDWTIGGQFSRENNTTQGFLPMDIGWYRKGLYFPESYAGKKIYIIFDGVYRSSDVWMNYAWLGHHGSGYTSFYYDITDYVRTGNRIPNGLRVRVDGRRHEEDMYEGNGIYRHVWLLITNKLHIDLWGTFVSTADVSGSRATIKIQTKIKNDNSTNKKCELITMIVNDKGIIVGEVSSEQTLDANTTFEFTQTVTIENPHLWDLDDPYLYKTYSILSEDNRVVDTYETPFGIRTFHFDPDNGFFLNNKHVKLQGFNAHYDFAGIGTALPDRIHWNAMMAMKKAGFNFYRSSHNPATPERLDICDQIGMLVWDEVERKLESMEIELPLVEETITRDRNHPSVIVWSLENESPLESTIFGAKIMKKATELAHQLDPTRLTTFAASMPVNKNGYGEAVDVVSYNYHWQRAEQDHLNFPDWKIGLISEYSAARARRGGYGIGSSQLAKDDPYFELNQGIETMYQMCTRVEESWQRIKVRDFIGGGCLWSGIDAWGEGNNWPLISRGDGALDLCFFPKDVYYYFVSQWTEEPMIHIFPHWNWKIEKGQLLDVWSYTNCDSVELFLNGRSLGWRSPDPGPAPWTPPEKKDNSFTQTITVSEHLAWKVPYDRGTLKAIGMKGGEIVCRETVSTTGEPYKIQMTLAMETFLDKGEIPPLAADGRDIAVIKAAVLDKDGNIVPTADNNISFAIEGNAKIIGVGNGNISSHEPNRDIKRKAYNGLCVAIVQSATNTAEVTVTASSPGLKSGKISIVPVSPQPTNIIIDADTRTWTSKNKTTLTVSVGDKYGSTIGDLQTAVRLNITGPAVFENGQKSFSVDTKDGKAVVAISPGNDQGSVIVTAKASGLNPGQVEIIRK